MQVYVSALWFWLQLHHINVKFFNCEDFHKKTPDQPDIYLQYLRTLQLLWSIWISWFKFHSNKKLSTTIAEKPSDNTLQILYINTDSLKPMSMLSQYHTFCDYRFWLSQMLQPVASNFKWLPVARIQQFDSSYNMWQLPVTI